jgi:NAD-specific glutamate dehydrogenase
LGGIPHDVYGMTSLSVRQYLLGLYRTHGLTEKNVTKVQIGGPDGDLGSNEILLSNDKTVAIVDGSGVLHDPNGIDRTELTRLAKARQTVSNVDRSKIGPGGYLILLEDKGFQLPCELRASAHCLMMPLTNHPFSPLLRANQLARLSPMVYRSGKYPVQGNLPDHDSYPPSS